MNSPILLPSLKLIHKDKHRACWRRSVLELGFVYKNEQMRHTSKIQRQK